MDFKKLLGLVTSRKFLAALAAILVVFNVIPEGEEQAFQEALLTVITSIGYILGVALDK